MMVKKVVVFQSEYEFLTLFHRKAMLELTELRAERDALKQENAELHRQLEEKEN